MQTIMNRLCALWSLCCLCSLLCLSCKGTSSNNNNNTDIEEDLSAKQKLQGIWINDDIGMPFMRFEGDSVYYSDSGKMPVAFKVVNDSIIITGAETISYKIEKQTDYTFWFKTLSEDIVKLSKSETPEDSLAFSEPAIDNLVQVSEKTQKDSIIIYSGVRYRGYVFVNPSSRKVLSTSIDQNGMTVDNVYYDNVMHICVYDGKKLLFGQDIDREMFSNVISEDILQKLVLSDMNFIGVDAEGFHYQALLSIPNSSASYLMNVDVSKDKHLSIASMD